MEKNKLHAAINADVMKWIERSDELDAEVLEGAAKLDKALLEGFDILI